MIVQGDDCNPRSPSIVASPLPPKSHSPPLPLVPEMRREERQENEKENKEKENKEMGNKEKEKENNVVSSCDNSEEERQRREECQTVETSSPAPCEVTNQVHCYRLSTLGNFVAYRTYDSLTICSLLL